MFPNLKTGVFVTAKCKDADIVARRMEHLMSEYKERLSRLNPEDFKTCAKLKEALMKRFDDGLMIATKIHGASLSAIESCIRDTTVSTRRAAQIRFKQKLLEALEKSKLYEEFKTVLESYSVRVVDRIGKEGDIIGVTFVDDEFKNIMNGSVVGRGFSYSSLQRNFDLQRIQTQGITPDQGTY